MYIRIVTQKNKLTGQVYVTHSLVEAYRNAEGKVRQHTLMNLGTQFDIPKEYWKILADRIEEIRQGQVSLLELDPILEKEAQRIAKLIIQKYSETLASNQKPTQKQSDYQTVDLNIVVKKIYLILKKPLPCMI
jgi:hypothetical protein